MLQVSNHVVRRDNPPSSPALALVVQDRGEKLQRRAEVGLIFWGFLLDSPNAQHLVVWALRIVGLGFRHLEKSLDYEIPFFVVNR